MTCDWPQLNLLKHKHVALSRQAGSRQIKKVLQTTGTEKSLHFTEATIYKDVLTN